jgi:hypothetical protein
MASDTLPKKGNYKSAGTEKFYCSPFAKTRYKILITGNQIKITRLYKEYADVINGILKKGRIYSNDPYEKGSEGRYYKFKKNAFLVLNVENGEYEAFNLCK